MSAWAGFWLILPLAYVLSGRLVPEFLAGWRGAHLIYPRPAQLLLERARWAGLLVGGMVGLGSALVLWSYAR